MKIYFHLLLLLFTLNQTKSKLSNELVNVSVKSVELPQASCIPSLSTFIYQIKVDFSKSPAIKNILSLDLSSNIKSLCYPFENTSVTDSFFQCEINTVDFPIKNKKIFLPLKAPNSNFYNFIDWENTIGKTPDISNKISDKEINCIPKELNSYKINEIKSEGCVNDNNIISLKGQWENESIQIPENYKIILDKLNGNCTIINPTWTQCEFKGYGKNLFSDDFYFKNGINTFMIQKMENSIDINDCNYNCFIFIRKIFLLLLLLLSF